jgi:hypothetical protein
VRPYVRLGALKVGVIVFTVVVNKEAGVFNLTTADLRGIFRGTITHGQQVGGANLPVRIVGLTGHPVRGGGGTLVAAFLAYLNDDTANDILRSASYIPCADRQQGLVSTICRDNQP